MNKAEELALLVKEHGGTAYYVGGYVRDKLMGCTSNDIDIEVHGIYPDDLVLILKKIGSPSSFGSSFGIYSLENMDVAMPRTEDATGIGHKDFEVYVDPFIGTEKASRRRDFTINSIMQNILTGEIIDHFGGIGDIENRRLRHVDELKFGEDPLRVLRCAQFASRFEFSVAPETVELCSKMDISSLTKERVEGELRKGLVKGKKPSIFFETLKNMNQLSPWFSEMELLDGILQSPVYHPEGNV